MAAAQAEKITTSAAARQSVVSQLSSLLRHAGLVEEAKTLLLAALENTEAPYYFMSGLAAIAEQEQEIPTALQWRKSAFDSSEGSATRLQWGASYVRTLIRLTPEADADITTTTEQLVAQGGTDQDLFSGRNFRVMRSLSKALNQWQENNEALNRLMDSLDQRCKALVDEPVLQQNCQGITTPWQTPPPA